MQEEIFGPIIPILTYDNIDEVIDYVQTEQEKPLVVYYFGDKKGENCKKVST